MLKAEQFAVALIIHQDNELFITGSTVDIGRLGNAGLVERSWDIKLDNGHRPFASLKKRVTFDTDASCEQGERNILTKTLSAATSLDFTQNLHYLENTYLIRKTPDFWCDLFITFADEDGRLRDIIPTDFYALYRGYIVRNISSVRFIRLEPDTLV